MAAPTAGLHFTENIFASLPSKKINTTYVTLHVGAGTFKPVKAGLLQGHDMHAEWIDVSETTISAIIENLSNPIIATGTTSLRTIESLYWMGVRSILFPESTMEGLSIQQWDVYESPLASTGLPASAALHSLLNWMKRKHCKNIIAKTQILIAPGYAFKIATALITNFHQPQSTLLLLIAAAIGDNWKNMYTYALENNYRFLSYGDGCLLFIPNS